MAASDGKLPPGVRYAVDRGYYTEMGYEPVRMVLAFPAPFYHLLLARAREWEVRPAVAFQVIFNVGTCALLTGCTRDEAEKLLMAQQLIEHGLVP